MKMLVAQSYLILCDSMDYSLPGSSVHKILQARMLEWVAIPFSRGSSQLRDVTQFSCIAGAFSVNLLSAVWPITIWHIHHFKECPVHSKRVR